MADENKDLNTDQSVADTDLNADVVDQQDLNNADSVDQQTQDDTLADGSSASKTVPYSELKKATDARKVAEEQTAYAQRQLEMMQQQATQTQQVQQTSPKSAMEQAMTDCGTTAEEMGYDGAMQVKVQNRKDQIVAERTQQNQAVFSNQQFIATHPDTDKVVGSVNPATGQIMTVSPELFKLLAEKPHLQAACTSVQAAYDIVMEQRELTRLTKAETVAKEHLIRTGVDTATQPMGSSAAGGGGTGSQGNQNLLSRDQSEEIRRKLAAGESIS